MRRLLFGIATLGIVSSVIITKSGYASDEHCRQLLRDNSYVFIKNEYVVYDEDYKIVARIKPTLPTIKSYKRRYNRAEKLYERKPFTPLQLKRGVSTFKERRSFDYRRKRN